MESATLLTTVGRAGGLFSRSWPRLFAWYLAAQLAHLGLMWLAVRAGYHVKAVGIALLAAVVLVSLLMYVGMFLLLRPELVALRLDVARHVPRSLGEGMLHVPLLSHAHYRREEILAALGWASMSRKAYGHAQGVAWCPETRADALLVNLRKTERDFSPTTMYRDFALSPSSFHWESQNATTVASAAGQRYLNHAQQGTHIALFVRETPTDDLGPAPFLCLGLCEYVEHQGERPIAITWRLRRAMPGETFRAAGVVAS